MSRYTETLQSAGQKIIAQLESGDAVLVCTQTELFAWDGTIEQKTPLGLIKRIARENTDMVILSETDELIRLKINATREEISTFFSTVKKLGTPPKEAAPASAHVFGHASKPETAVENTKQTSLGRAPTITRATDLGEPLRATDLKEPAARAPKGYTRQNPKVPVDMGSGYWQHELGFLFEYASFGQRAVALLIDGLIAGTMNRIIDVVVSSPVRANAARAKVLLTQLNTASDSMKLEYENIISKLPSLTIQTTLLSLVLTGIATWLYYAYFESGSRHGTPGKMAQRIGVTDLNIERISFLRASQRYLWRVLPFYTIVLLGAALALMRLSGKPETAQILSAATTFGISIIVGTLINVGGLILAAFSKNKQALHDLMAHTFVIKA